MAVRSWGAVDRWVCCIQELQGVLASLARLWVGDGGPAHFHSGCRGSPAQLSTHLLRLSMNTAGAGQHCRELEDSRRGRCPVQGLQATHAHGPSLCPLLPAGPRPLSSGPASPKRKLEAAEEPPGEELSKRARVAEVPAPELPSKAV